MKNAIEIPFPTTARFGLSASRFAEAFRPHPGFQRPVYILSSGPSPVPQAPPESEAPQLVLVA